jgi:hypothetical protein
MHNFKELRTKSQIANQLLDIANDGTDWHSYYDFGGKIVPEEVLKQDMIMSYMFKKYKFVAGVLMIPPNTCYNWHTDSKRKVSINMLLKDDGRSRCLFADSIEGVTFPFVELQYKPDTYYIFNTQNFHMVINDSIPRYMFSMEFFDTDQGLTYADLCIDLFGN